MFQNKIVLNEIGYCTGDIKKAVYRGPKADKFYVIDTKEDMSVFEGQIFEAIYNEAADEYDYILDFTDCIKNGSFYIKVDEEKSVIFEIKEDIYDELSVDLLRFYYLQRCGMELTEDMAGKFAHKVCHISLAKIYGTDKRIDVCGGWHDAGDYGRYVTPACVTIQALFIAIENDERLLKLDLNIPKSSKKTGINTFGAKKKLPDVLTEIKYELDWMLKMQNQENGQVYHKVTCASFCEFVMPEEETEELIVAPASVTATADFAAVMARAYTVYKPYDADYAAILESASKKAYDAIRTITPYEGFKNPDGIVTGEYSDPYIEDESYWASAELYKAFLDPKYKEDFEAFVKKEVWFGYGWEDVASFGNIAYLSLDDEYTDKDIREKLEKAVIEKADQFLEIAQKDSYGISFRADDFIWGSNMYLLENGSSLFDAYVLTGDEKYYNAAKEHIDYCLGKNPCDICFVTGYGEHTVYNPHHRPSSFVKEAMKGMLVGGPNKNLQDETTVAACSGMAKSKCYVDKLLSYSTNEVTIYWNSALLMLIAQIYG